MRVNTRPRLFEQVLPHATALFADSAQLESRFQAFRSAEAGRNPRDADDIRALAIDTIDFVNPRRPNCAEVSFTAESGGEAWTCLLVDGAFTDLSMES